MEIEEAIKEYIKNDEVYEKERDRIRNRIHERGQQITRLEKKREKLECPSWIDGIIKPIAEAMLKELPGRRYEILGPFGLDALTSIHFYNVEVNEKDKFKGGNCISITFTPRNLEKGELAVKDHRKNTKQYSPGTIGELNGMNYPSVPMETDLKWLMDWLKHQNSEKSKED